MIVPKRELDHIKQSPRLSDELAQKIFAHYREHGFPHFDLSQDDVRREFDRVRYYDYSNIIIEEDAIKQIMHGLALAWWKFPHAVDIRCNGLRTPLEVFNDDELFMKCIHKRIRLGDNISDNGIKKMLKIFTGTQAVSNFRPTAAKFIYDKYAGGGNVYDMSCGFGGRLIGAMASSRVKHYTGVEPSTDTYKGLLELTDALKLNLGVHKGVEIYQKGSEDFYDSAFDHAFDLCFTSPPYFNCEEYSDEPTQSYIKFPTKEQWLEGFLKQTLDNCHRMLKDNGYIIMNVAGVKDYPKLEYDLLELMKDKYSIVGKWRYALSGMFRHGFKYEPMYVFKKKK